ncbi:ABC transporter ATP-binding protein [Lachnoanaerobaculum umeaense]|uniref:ABC transporter ATP-binding protein n=1 Tax=Lachnoanaerobaculum umeaense TaxID=617123 RepID=A0A385Q1Q0_9FIRM|nr:ABC transporter ATP-binding protein [Lachnoanaerobaculum umeaense]AYA99517.1 ABC transporter ATP-binding protein [Lachnoanaerobaculum umeaense]PZW95857.1 ATP-binding cassette subfamily B protein [Lachnoanaerobaculum umeaense]
MLKVLAKYIKEYKVASLLTIVFIIGEVVFELLIPYMMTYIIDKGVAINDFNAVIKYGSIMILLAILGLICGIAAGIYGANASAGFAKNLREGMFRNIQNFSFSNIDKFSSASLVTRLTTDITNVQNSYQMILRMLMRAPATLIFALVMTVTISRDMSVVFFVAIFFLATALAIIIAVAFKLFNLVFEKYDALNANVQENISGIRVVKSYVQEEREISKFDTAISNLYKLFVKAESLVVINNPLMMLTVYGCIIALSWFGAQRIVSGTLTTGELTSLFSYIMSILIALMMLSFAFVMITISEASAKRIAEVLVEESDIKSKDNACNEVKDGSVDFDNVSFSYKAGIGKPVLSNINIHIASGQTIGILGGTGSAKSSLVNLIPRLYDATGGSVYVGGKNVKDYDLKVLRDSVSVVLQKNVLFSGTIIDNLRWGNENATLDEIKKACELACADEFIERMPEKYDTWIERGGNNVSGGQKQRLCIARALLKNPKILILDDSTSAVDTATDAKIRKAFRDEIPNTTKIIISQRISSIKDADKIIVLDKGKIVGFDTHERLLETNEIYKTTANAQSEGNADFDKAGV